MLAAAGERIARQLPVAVSADDGMEWEDIGQGEEEDDFLVGWKAQVRNDGGDVNSESNWRVHRSFHCLTQMCVLLQPLHDNMAQASTFVQVAPLPLSLSVNFAAPLSIACLVTRPLIHNSSNFIVT